jgi:hypothetical protein
MGGFTMTTDSDKLDAAKTRLIQCSYAFAGILSGMTKMGQIPDEHKENARIWLRHHDAAAKERLRALGIAK